MAVGGAPALWLGDGLAVLLLPKIRMIKNNGFNFIVQTHPKLDGLSIL